MHTDIVDIGFEIANWANFVNLDIKIAGYCRFAFSLLFLLMLLVGYVMQSNQLLWPMERNK